MMPWDTPPPGGQPPYRPPTPPPQQPAYQPPPQQPAYQPPPQQYTPPPAPQTAQQMRPDAVPVVARNPQTGEQVRMDLGPSIAQLISSQVAEALAQNQDALQANLKRAVTNKVTGKKTTLTMKPDDDSALEVAEDALEEAWSAGPVTARTLIQGLTIDLVVGAAAVLTTVLTPDKVLDVDAWIVAGSMLAKTAISTLVSFAVKVKVN